MSYEEWSEPVTCPRCGFGASWRYQGDHLYRCEECGTTDVLPSRKLKGVARAEPPEPDHSRNTG